MTSIVVPVHNAPRQLARCLTAVKRTLPTGIRVILLDDASTDSAIPEIMQRYDREWIIRSWSENAGFVETANRGIELAGRDDVLLLNSDTIPAGDWFTRMVSAGRSDRDVASVTPWSNNGEIVSLPEFCRPAPVPDSPQSWAEACSAAGSPVYPELPTAVGFCMWMSRQAIEDVGFFDTGVFGRGYGEENDWCMRASRAGWRHILCDDAFVAHEGGASFRPLGLSPGGEALARVQARHPGYSELISRFIQRDPLAARRRDIIASYNAIVEQGVAP